MGVLGAFPGISHHNTRKEGTAQAVKQYQIKPFLKKCQKPLAILRAAWYIDSVKL